MSSSKIEQPGCESMREPGEVQKQMAAMETFVSEPRCPASELEVRAPEDSAPLAAGIQSLFSLVSLMRTMNTEPAGSPVNPKLILSGSGVEVRFADEKLQPGTSEEWHNRMERDLRDLREANASLVRTVSELEGKLATQVLEVAVLRASVDQNEQLMETLVDSINLVDDLGDAKLGTALLVPRDTLAS
jgi:hypothetical protein